MYTHRTTSTFWSGVLSTSGWTVEWIYTLSKVSSSEYRIWQALAVGVKDDFPWLFLDTSMDAVLDTPRYDGPKAALNSHTDDVGYIYNDNVCGITDI